MKRLNDDQKKYFYWGLTIFLSLSLALIVSNLFPKLSLILDFFGAIFSALTPLWIGLIIAYLMNPVVRFFEKKVFLKLFKNKHKNVARGISVALSILLMFGFLTGLSVLVIPQLIDTAKSLANNIPTYFDDATNSIKTFMSDHSSLFSEKTQADILDNIQNASNTLVDILKNSLPTLLSSLGDVLSSLVSVAGVVVDFFVGIIISIYLLCDKDNFLAQTKKFLAAVLPERWYIRLMTMFSETHHVFGEFITGKLIDSLFVGVVTFVFLWIMGFFLGDKGMPYSTLIAVLLAVCNLIPFFGQFIGIIPSALLLLAHDPLSALIFVVFIVVFMQVDANVISPKILGNSIGLGSFWILFAIIFFGGMFGVVGMLIGVPVFAMIYRIVTRYMDKHLRKKGLPTEAYEYRDAVGPTFPDRKTRRKLRKEEKNAKANGASEAGAAASDTTKAEEPTGSDDAASDDSAESEATVEAGSTTDK